MREFIQRQRDAREYDAFLCRKIGIAWGWAAPRGRGRRSRIRARRAELAARPVKPERESAGRRQHSKTVSRLSPTYAPTGMDQLLSDLAGQAPRLGRAGKIPGIREPFPARKLPKSAAPRGCLLSCMRPASCRQPRNEGLPLNRVGARLDMPARACSYPSTQINRRKDCRGHREFTLAPGARTQSREARCQGRKGWIS
jgi:hypothetical protein